MGIWYTTRESVKAALDENISARGNAQVDRAIEAASRTAEGVLHRRFYPELATKYFDWPQDPGNRSYRIWLDDQQLVSLASATSGGTALAPADILLEPANDGPPFDRVETNRSTSATWSTGTTEQRSIALTGTWGYQLVDAPAATLTAGVNAAAGQLPVSTSTIGVGSLLLVDSERMTVTGKRQVDTTVTITSNVNANQGTTLIPVSSGASIAIGEVILVDAEYMLVIDIAGNNLLVKRAWDGSVLATHNSGAALYAPRSLTAQRGLLGTTAATHNSSATVSAFQYPADLVTFVTALAIDTILQERGGYARTWGTGDSEQEASGKSLRVARQNAITSLGRQSRLRSV